MDNRLRDTTHSGKPRCQARKSSGSTWVAGREQCLSAAKPGEVFCGTHLNQRRRKAERRHAMLAARATGEKEAD